MSALRDELDGTGQQIDQGLTNADPRYIAVPASYINLIPTDVRGLTLNRSPQQVRSHFHSPIVSEFGCSQQPAFPVRMSILRFDLNAVV